MDAEVFVAELEPPLMPPICIKTGRPATATRVARFVHVPNWVYFLLPTLIFGLLIMAIISESVTTRLTVTFPVASEVAGSRKRRITIAWSLGAGGPLVCIGLGFATHLGSLFATIALATLFAGVCVALTIRPWLRGKLTKEGLLRLRNVAPEWVAAHKALVDQHRAFYAQQALQYQQAVSAQHQAAFYNSGGYYPPPAQQPPATY